MSPAPIHTVRGLLLTIALAAVSAACAPTHTTGNAAQHETQRSTTMSTKETVGAFLGAVMNGDAATMRQLANADYIQHNPYVPTGLEPFIGMLPVLQAAGTTPENVRMFQDGNYVFMHNLWHNAKPFGADEMVSFDILRVDDHGKVAEHWDAMTTRVSTTASGRTQTDGPTTSTDGGKTEANKAIATAMVEDILMGKNPEKIGDYISAETFQQHNPLIKDGLAGLGEAVAYLTSQNNMFRYTKIHKVLAEGDFVLVVSEGQWNGTTNAFYDLLRFEDGKAVEHWDVIQPVPAEGLANANGMFGF
jgi:predicted SnoaL-like aldol condensation-catalyzing enzyme